MVKRNNKNYIFLHDIITLKSVLYRVGMTLKVLSRDPIQHLQHEGIALLKFLMYVLMVKYGKD